MPANVAGAANLEQLKVGDRVVVRYLQALSLDLKKDGKEVRSRIDTTDGARAAAGGRPGGVAAQQVEVTADVIAVNSKTQIVRLRGPEQVVDLRVRDPEQLKLIKVGDQIQAVYAQALALSVEPAPNRQGPCVPDWPSSAFSRHRLDGRRWVKDLAVAMS